MAAVSVSTPKGKIWHQKPTLSMTPRRSRTENKKDELDASQVHHIPDYVQFAVFSSEEIKSLSVCELTNPISFNQLQHPLPGGLYDLRMGPSTDSKRDVFCQTCLLAGEHCPGHMGHISLPLPVVNPLFHSTLLSLLKLTCLKCGEFRIPDYQKQLFLVRQKLVDKGLLIAAEKAISMVVNDAEELEGSGEKTKKSITPATDIGNVMKLKEFYDQEVRKANIKEYLGRPKMTRSLEELKKRYVRDFLHEKKSKSCRNCKFKLESICLDKSRVKYKGRGISDEDQDESGNITLRMREFDPLEIKNLLRTIWKNEAELLLLLYPMLQENKTEFPTDAFLIETVAVPPPKTRPCMFAGGILTMHPQSTGLQHVIETTNVLKHVLRNREVSSEDWTPEVKELIETAQGDTIEMKLHFLWRELQGNVDQVMDKEMKTTTTNRLGWGLKQLIERKKGIFRMYMMGKRVNYACRTVITPDPNISVDEIGIPEIFAKTLTYREAVTPHNVEKLRQMVLNGPDVHPGANAVEEESGFKITLDARLPNRREALAKTLLTPGQGQNSTKYVYRHLLTGDAMLLNRQPTLHKPSILCHRARVLKGEKVMRLHYATCKSYNADFDGDEMNAHFPQNEVSRSEAYNIVSVCKNYLVPKDGTPLQGLIQDHIISGVKMTMRGRFFNREEYQQLVFGALVDHPGRIRTVPPAILKPKPLWSGKQIVTTIILNLVPKSKEPPTLLSSSKVKGELWVKVAPRTCMIAGGVPTKKTPFNTTMSESEVIFRQGEFISGILDKNQYGATQYGLVHSFFELYGGKYSAKLLSCFSKIFTNFLRTEGFTLGVHDIVVQKQANHNRKKINKITRKIGKLCASNGVGLIQEEDETSPDDISDAQLASELQKFHRESRLIPKKRMDIDRAYKDKLTPATNDINNVCLPKGLVKSFPDNNLQLMVQSGAKGSTVNTMQISCLLGQIELEGKRPPLMISGKSLPSFIPYDTQPRAGGYIDGRFMSGIRPQEFFFHCMAGREGLIDTAVKTSRSGYLQRCLIKHLEGLVVNYDMTVRDSDKSVIQFQYGEDSLDVCKLQYLKPRQFDFLLDNKKSIMDKKAIKTAKSFTDKSGVKAHWEQVQKIKSKKAKQPSGKRDSAFLRFYNDRIKDMDIDIANLNNLANKDELKKTLIDEYRKKKASKKGIILKYEAKAKRCPDPTHTVFRPDSNFGSINEKLDDMIKKYVHEKSKQSQNFDADAFTNMCYQKAMQSVVDPGEPVGVLAAQSVGEPSTQMTLNTFHFAGRGDMNVTLGIPRLREILMVASANIKTPSMVIPFLPEVTEKQRENLRVMLCKVTMADVLEKVQVTEKIQSRVHSRKKIVRFRFEFLPRKYYKSKYAVNPKKILRYFESRFISKVFLPVIKSAITDKVALIDSDKDKGSHRQENDSFDDNDGDLNENSVNRWESQDKGGEAHVSSDEEELPDDADATQARKAIRQQDEDFDEGLSEEEEEMIRDLTKKMEGETRDADDGFDEEDFGPNEDDIRKNQEDEEEATRAVELALMNENMDAKKRQTKVLGLGTAYTEVLDYCYDTRKEEWCELTLGFKVSHKTFDFTNVLKKSTERAVVLEVRNLKRAFVTEDKKGNPTLTVEGINIEAMFKFDRILDLNKLSCNNIHDMAKYYGIEAATKTIVHEIVTVFEVYGITVNPHHLKLIAEYMTFDGTYKPFNRAGFENNPNPFQQMTFETAVGFLRSAILNGKVDSLDSPSSCIVTGKPCPGGTNGFQIRQRLEEIN